MKLIPLILYISAFALAVGIIVRALRKKGAVEIATALTAASVIFTPLFPIACGGEVFLEVYGRLIPDNLDISEYINSFNEPLIQNINRLTLSTLITIIFLSIIVISEVILFAKLGKGIKELVEKHKHSLQYAEKERISYFPLKREIIKIKRPMFIRYCRMLS